MSSLTPQTIFRQINEGLITSLEKAQLPENEITTATEVLKIQITQFSQTDFAQISDLQKKYITIANMVKKAALERIFQEGPLENITITVLSPKIESSISKKATKVFAGILGGGLILSGPWGWGILGAGAITYLALKK